MPDNHRYTQKKLPGFNAEANKREVSRLIYIIFDTQLVKQKRALYCMDCFKSFVNRKIIIKWNSLTTYNNTYYGSAKLYCASCGNFVRTQSKREHI